MILFTRNFLTNQKLNEMEKVKKENKQEDNASLELLKLLLTSQTKELREHKELTKGH